MVSDPQSESPPPENERPAQASGFASFWQELRQRKVVRTGIAYIVIGMGVMEGSDIVLGNLGAPQWLVSAMIILVILGFPVAMVVAWIYDLTPQGIQATDTQKSEDGSSARTVKAQHSLPLLLTAAAVPTILFGALAIFFYFRTSTHSSLSAPSSEQTAIESSIAVLPLANLSPDPDNAFFADGVQEDILTHLSKVNELLVIGRTSTLQYRDTVKTLNEIGTELGVRYLVEGSVRRAGEQVRVTVQLIDTESGGHMWAENYDRPLLDIFSIQSAIAKEIARQLKMVLMPDVVAAIERPPTNSIEAYDLYNKSDLISDPWERLAMLKRALELDPDYLDAWFSIGFRSMLMWRSRNRQDTSLYDQAKEAMEQVRRLSLDGSKVLELQGIHVYNETGDIASSLELLLEADAINPNSFRTKNNIGLRYMQLGQLSEARPYLEAYLKINPLDAANISRMHNLYIRLGLWDDAQAVIENIVNRSGDLGRRGLIFSEQLANMDFIREGNGVTLLGGLEREFGESRDLQRRLVEVLINRDYASALALLKGVNPNDSGGILRNQFSFTYESDSLASWCLEVQPVAILRSLILFEQGKRTELASEAKVIREYLEAVIANASLADPDYYSMLAVGYALEGERVKVDEMVQKTRELSQTANYQYRFEAKCEMHLATAYLILGDNDKGIQILEAASRLKSAIFFNRELEIWFVFDRLKGNPRFDKLLEGGA